MESFGGKRNLNRNCECVGEEPVQFGHIVRAFHCLLEGQGNQYRLLGKAQQSANAFEPPVHSSRPVTMVS